MTASTILLGLLITAAAAAAAATAVAETRAVAPERSTITVHVGKSGLMSAFGDEHDVRAPVASGTLADAPEPRVEVVVDARKMTVLDPKLSSAKRDEVQKRMLGPEVLDVERFPEIRFRSTAVKRAAPGRWRVEGELTLHGKTAPLAFDVNESGERFHGRATLRQTSFGIRPIRVAAGTVRVRDEVEVELEIVTSPAAAPASQ